MNAFVERGVRSDGLVALSREVRVSAIKDQGMMKTMLMKWLKYPQGPAALRERATDGIRTCSTGFAPGLVLERPGPEADDPSAAGWMRRFARDVIATNPVSRSPLSPVQIYLIELALECVDWPALTRDRRLRHLDWSRASLVYPRTERGAAGFPGSAPRPVEAA